MKTTEILVVAVVLLGLSSITTHAIATDSNKLSCEVADDLAGKSYTRTAEAKNAGNLVAAHQQKLAFWDIFKYGSHCENVKKLALQLSAKKLGAEDDPPSGQEAFKSLAVSAGLNLPASCFSGGAFACRLIVSEPPKDNTAGREGKPNFYLLDESSYSTIPSNGPTWKKFAGPKLELPVHPEWKK